MPVVKIELITSDAEFRALGSMWNQILNDSAANNIFLTWEWISTWWEHFGPARQLWILLARSGDSNQIVGLAPLNLCKASLIPGFFPYHRELSFLGANDVAPDHLDFVIRQEYEEQVAEAFLDYIFSHPEWDLLRLDGLRSASPLAPLLKNRMNSWGSHLFKKNIAIIHLPAKWETYRSRLGKNLRKNLRRYLQQLEDDHPGQVQFERVENASELDDGIMAAIRLAGEVRESRRESYSFNESENQLFLRKVAARFFSQNWIWVSRLRVNGEDIAASISYIYNRAVFFYQSGYNLAWKKYRLGSQIQVYDIQQAIEAGVLRADFLRGEEDYKNEWASDSLRTDLYFKLGHSLKGRMLITFYAMTRYVYFRLLNYRNKLSGRSVDALHKRSM